MKVKALFLFLVMLLALAFPVGATQESKGECSIVTVPLRCGRETATVGSVSAWFEDGSLLAKYETTGNWYLTEIHLIAVKDLKDVPVTPNDNSNPRIGHFPVKTQLENPVQEYFAELSGDETWEEGDTLYVLAKASLVRIEDGETVPGSDEGAWGGEEEFDSQRFAYYFMVTVCQSEAPIDPVDPVDPIDPLDPIDPVDPGDEDPKGEEPVSDGPGDEDPVGENPGSQLPVTGTNVAWLFFPALGLVGVGLSLLMRK